MNDRRSLLAIVALSLAFLLAGCSAAKLSSSWKQDGYTGKSSNMLVIGVSSHQGRRQIFESTLVENLKERGIRAIPSYTVFADQEMYRQTVIDYATQENIESVIVTKVLDSQSFKQRVTHATGGNPVYRGYNGWHDDYSYWRTNIITYDTNYRLSNLEANLYLLEGKNMVWSALVEVESQEDDQSAITDLADLLVRQMAKEGVI